MAISTPNSDDSSPRISFSDDLQPQQNPISEPQNCSSGSVSDFDFCITCSETEQETYPADELFFNGVIIPTQMKEKLNMITNEEITDMTRATLVREEKITGTNTRSFWSFRRSSSMNCEKQRGSIWANLPLLLRSRSTGSAPIVNKIQPKKKNRKKLTKSEDKLPPQSQKSCGKMKDGRNYGGSVLNVPPPYIAKGTSDLLGLGSFFRNGSREKKCKN